MSNLAVVGYNNSKTVIGGNTVLTQPHIPNTETLAAMQEADEHLRQLKAGEIQPRFNNLAEFFICLLSDEGE